RAHQAPARADARSIPAGRPSPVHGLRKPGRIGDAQVVPLEPQETLRDKVSQQPVHGLARATDHAGELTLRIRPRLTHLADRYRLTVRHDLPEQVLRQPTPQV